MAKYSIVGDDTFLFNGTRQLKDFAFGSTIEITFDNDKVTLDTGKDGNTVFAVNPAGGNATATLRMLRGSDDDKYLNGLKIQQDNDPIGFSLLYGSFSKRIGNGKGNINYDRYTLEGGMFQKDVDGQEDTQGNTEQGITLYTIVFAKAIRALT